MPQCLAGPVGRSIGLHIEVDIIHGCFDAIQEIPDDIDAVLAHQNLTGRQCVRLGQAASLIGALAMGRAAVSARSSRSGG